MERETSCRMGYQPSPLLAGFPVNRFGSWRVIYFGIGTLTLSAPVLSAATAMRR
ncbi:MAG TPA: hypothetical protein VMV91_16610 [Rhodocyclaceae bacterium]|nr:hypothetical protein [Rhodocyclaceae bacterium]